MTKDDVEVLALALGRAKNHDDPVQYAENVVEQFELVTAEKSEAKKAKR